MFNQSSPLLTKQGVEVLATGDKVILRVGNVDLPMGFEQALDLSRWIREEASLAKRGSGRARTLRSLGVLRDLDAKAKALPYQGGVAIHIKERLQDWDREDVTLDGNLVRIKIGTKVFSLHFESALKVSQWLRVRAKEAQRMIGDTRHWSEVGVS